MGESLSGVCLPALVYHARHACTYARADKDTHTYARTHHAHQAGSGPARREVDAAATRAEGSPSDHRRPSNHRAIGAGFRNSSHLAPASSLVAPVPDLCVGQCLAGCERKQGRTGRSEARHRCHTTRLGRDRCQRAGAARSGGSRAPEEAPRRGHDPGWCIWAFSTGSARAWIRRG